MTGMRLRWDENSGIMLALSGAIVLAGISERFHTSYFEYISILIVVVLLLNKSQKYFIYAIVFLMAGGDLMTLLGIGIPTILAIVSVLKEIFWYRRPVNRRFLISSLAVLLYSGLFLIQGDLYAFAMLAKVVILLYCLIASICDAEDLAAHVKWMVRYFVVGTSITVVSALVIHPYFLRGMRWAISENTGVNLTAVVLGLMFTICLIWFVKEKNVATLYVGAIVAAIGVLLTGSRAGILLVGVSVAWMMLYVLAFGNVKLKKYFLTLAIAAFIGLVIFIILNAGVRETLLYMVKKIVSPKGGDISNGRFTLWEEYINTWGKDTFWIFWGAGTYTNMGFKSMAHNMIIEQLTQLGIIGNILIINLYYITYVTIKKNWNKKMQRMSYSFMPAVLVINIFVAGMTGHSFLSIINTTIFWLGVLLMFAFPYWEPRERRIRRYAW